jgi:WD40 repeat protein
MTEETIFTTALEKQSAAERSAYLEEACAGDPALRQRVEALLKSHEEAGHFLEHPALHRAGAEESGGPGETQTGPGDGGREDLDLDFLAPSERPGALGRLGHYEVLAVVGRGGMGVVLKAFDNVLQRVVAVKVMAPQLAVAASARKRFIREAQAAAAVRDEHVIDIHAVEEVNGLPYLVMEYVNGISLQDRLDRSGPLELKEVLRIGVQTANGLAKAHAQGLVHRDVKPANILLENGVQRVKITDFGLARAVDDASLTQSGFLAGTPQYMAPEQARGEPVDHRADLFSLGSVLYAMCTGRPPFRASTTMAVLKRVSEDTPRPVREVNPEVPDWLAALIDRLHAKAPADRYQSAAEVAEELSRHLVRLQEPATAAAAAPWAVAPRPAARSPARRWAATAAVLLLLAGGLGVSEATGVTKLTATVIRIFSPDGTLVVEVDDPNVEVSVDGEDVRIVGAGLREVRLRPGPHRVQATRDGQPLRLDQELVTITRGGKQVVRVSREVPVKAVAEGKPRQAPSRPEATLLAHPGPAVTNYVAFTPDGRTLVVANEDGTLQLWDRATRKVRASWKAASLKVMGLALSPDGRAAALAAGVWNKPEQGGEVQVWELASGKPLAAYREPASALMAVAFAPDGRTLAVGAFSGAVRLLDATTGKVRTTLQGPVAGAMNALAFTADGATLVGAGAKPTGLRQSVGLVRLWDLKTGKERDSWLRATMEEVHCLCLSSDGRVLALGGRDHTVRLWDVAAGRERAALAGHTGWVRSLALSPDGRVLASGAYDGTIRLWDVAAGRELATLTSVMEFVKSVAFSPDGRALAAGGGGWKQPGRVELWDMTAPLPPAPRQQARQPGGRPFVLLPRQGKAEQVFATLAEAVGAAAAGDTVEVRGDGPFWLDASGVTINRALTIRAGPGCRPVFKLAAARPGQGRNKHLLDIYAAVTLEGLDFDRTGNHEGPTRERAALFVQNGPLRMANCRLRTGGLAAYLVWLHLVREADIRNCLFAGPSQRGICVAHCSDGDRLALTNCVFTGTGRAAQFTKEQDRLVSALRVELVGNTFAALPLGWDYSSSRELQVEARANVVVSQGVLVLEHVPLGKSWKELATAVRWEGKCNLYPAGRPPVEIDGRPATGSADLDGWKAGTPRFQGGDAQGWQEAMREADFWRLAADSPGKGAGKGGRDLGADVRLVGPGPAYERWKKAPEYRQWLRDTGQGAAE